MTAAPHLPTYFSFSQLTKYRQCPRSYAFEKVYGRSVPSGRAAVLGNVVHSFLELAVDLGVGQCWDDERSHASDEFRTAARQLFAAEYDVDNSNYRALDLDEDGVRAFRDEAWRVTRSYLRRLIAEAPAIESAERELKIDLAGVPFVCVVDRLDSDADGAITVVDYKTGERKRSGAKHADQVHVYARAVEIVDGTLPAAGVLSYQDRDIRLAISEGRVHELEAEVVDAWGEIKKHVADEEWLPATSALCSWCPFVGECTEGQIAVKRRWESGREVSADAAATLGLVGVESRPGRFRAA